MNLIEAKRKYIGKMVRCKSSPFVLFVANVYEFEGLIKVAFQHPYYRYIPKGQPLNSNLNELERDWEILG